MNLESFETENQRRQPFVSPPELRIVAVLGFLLVFRISDGSVSRAENRGRGCFGFSACVLVETLNRVLVVFDPSTAQTYFSLPNTKKPSRFRMNYISPLPTQESSDSKMIPNRVF